MKMSFDSISFFLFLFFFGLAYLAVPSRFKSSALFLFSCLYYLILDAASIYILTASILFDYYLAFIIVTSGEQLKRYLVLISIIANILILFLFKYFAMFNGVLLTVFNAFGWSFPKLVIDSAIPTGLSFFTFKKISYIIDIYRGEIEPEKNLKDFALYVIIFQEIVAGPIDRAGSLIPQIKNPPTLRFDNFKNGLLFILLGLAMKVVIANRLAIYTDLIFNNLFHYRGLSLLLASYFYTFQIYCDFAGYTLMAIGAGRILGYNFAANFDLPYFSHSISEFWRRWHITLSFWFRDYLYIPLGGNRRGKKRKYLNFMIVFLLCGLWHGANWTFVLWGGIHGMYLVVGDVTKSVREMILESFKIPQRFLSALQVLLTFHLVAFAWIFFRANTVKDAIYFISNLFSGWPTIFIDPNTVGYGMIGIVILVTIELLLYHKKLSCSIFFRLPMGIRWFCFYALIFSVILAGVDSGSAFIYAQF